MAPTISYASKNVSLAAAVALSVYTMCPVR